MAAANSAALSYTRVRLGSCPAASEARAGWQSGEVVYAFANRAERAASAFRCGACRKSAGAPSGKKLPLSWSTMTMRMFGLPMGIARLRRLDPGVLYLSAYGKASDLRDAVRRGVPAVCREGEAQETDEGRGRRDHPLAHRLRPEGASAADRPEGRLREFLRPGTRDKSEHHAHQGRRVRRSRGRSRRSPDAEDPLAGQAHR